MKKKLIAIFLCVALAAVAIVGASLAYFTDTDTKTNVFTTGKVDITLNDTFEQGSKLVPAVVEEDGTINNAVEKTVSVTNDKGSEDAYVRVHIAIPTSIRSLIGLWTFEGAENWEGASDTRVDTPNYTTTINGVSYDVFVFTYTDVLTAEDSTSNILDAVTMEDTATNDEIAAVNGTFNIIVFAEGTQAAGFSDAETALNAAFGTPSADANPWNNYGESAE